MRKHYLLVSDFDQTLRFNDSGLVLSEMLGITGFQDKVAHLARPRGLDLEGPEHGGRMECAGGSRTLPVPPLEVYRREVSERGVQPLAVVVPDVRIQVA